MSYINTKEWYDEMFSYHPPDDIDRDICPTVGRLSRALMDIIASNERHVYELRNQALALGDPQEMTPRHAAPCFDAINTHARTFAEYLGAIPALLPLEARTHELYGKLERAMLEIQLARMAGNEVVCAHIRRINTASQVAEAEVEMFRSMAFGHAIRAKWLGNMAVATRERK